MRVPWKRTETDEERTRVRVFPRNSKWIVSFADGSTEHVEWCDDRATAVERAITLARDVAEQLRHAVHVFVESSSGRVDDVVFVGFRRGVRLHATK